MRPVGGAGDGQGAKKGRDERHGGILKFELDYFVLGQGDASENFNTRVLGNDTKEARVGV